MRAALGNFGIDSINSLDAQKTIVLFVVLWGTYLTGNHVTGTQTEAANLRLRDIDIHIAR